MVITIFLSYSNLEWGSHQSFDFFFVGSTPLIDLSAQLKRNWVMMWARVQSLDMVQFQFKGSMGGILSP